MASHESKDHPIKKQSALGKARNHGSAKSGLHHFSMQRLTAIALLLLGPWFFWNLIGLDLKSYGAVVMWLQSPGDVTLMALFMGVGLYHGYLGLQTVIEDYVHTNLTKGILLITSKFSMFILGAMTLFSLVHIQSIDPSTFDTSKMSATYQDMSQNTFQGEAS